MNKAEIEKLLMWLLPMVFVAALADFALMQMINQMLGQVGTTVTQSVEEMSWLDRNFTLGEQISYLNILKMMPNILTRAVIGVWLHFQVQKLGGRCWLWGFAGLLLQYWAIALFFFTQLIERKSNEVACSESGQRN